MLDTDIFVAYGVLIDPRKIDHERGYLAETIGNIINGYDGLGMEYYGTPLYNGIVVVIKSSVLAGSPDVPISMDMSSIEISDRSLFKLQAIARAFGLKPDPEWIAFCLRS